MKEQFRDINFSEKRSYLLNKSIQVINQYDRLKIKLTLRQLYYQLVSKDFIPNKVSEYQKLSKLISDARYAGHIDWNAIEDRIRVPWRHAQWKSINDILQTAHDQFRLHRWDDQEYYVELWSEKDALTSILKPIADEWHNHYCMNRGYGSSTAMYDLSKRILNAINKEKKCVVLYLGDHDPSGLDMVRDIETRVKEFLTPYVDVDDDDYQFFKMEAIALTYKQVQKYNPPPNPAKITDPRAGSYISKYGRNSWEVDALDPEVMMDLVNQSIEKYCNVDLLDNIKEEEEELKESLRDFMGHFEAD